MEYLPISSLENRSHQFESKFIKGIVTLIWPFSSSAGKAAFLVADPDFRLRHKKGQVRVRVQGAAALALAKSPFAIGDEVSIGLRGSKIVENDPGVSTPGKSVELELQYGQLLRMEVVRNNEQVADIEVAYSASPSPVATPFATPRLQDIDVSRPYIYHGDTTVETPSTGQTPLFHRKARLSAGSFVDSPFDPFLEDDVERLSESRRKRVRTSWGNHTRWRLAGTEPSPDKVVSDNQAPENMDIDVGEDPQAASVDGAGQEPEQSTPAVNSSMMLSSSMETPSKLRPFRDPVPTVTYSNPLSKPRLYARDRFQTPTPHFEVTDSTTAMQINEAVLDTQVVDLIEPEIQSLVGSHLEKHTAKELQGSTSLQSQSQSSAVFASASQQDDTNFADNATQDSTSRSVNTNMRAASSLMGPPLAIPQHPKTPELQPLTPSGLPLPSPFPQEALSAPNHPTSYFPTMSKKTQWPTESPNLDSDFGFSFGRSLSPTKLRSQSPKMAESGVEKADTQTDIAKSSSQHVSPVAINDYSAYSSSKDLEMREVASELLKSRKVDSELHAIHDTNREDIHNGLQSSSNVPQIFESADTEPDSSLSGTAAIKFIPDSLTSQDTQERQSPAALPDFSTGPALLSQQPEMTEISDWRTFKSIQETLLQSQAQILDSLSSRHTRQNPLPEVEETARQFLQSSQGKLQVPTHSIVRSSKPLEDDFIDLTQPEMPISEVVPSGQEMTQTDNAYVFVSRQTQSQHDNSSLIDERDGEDDIDMSPINYSQAEIDDILDAPYSSSRAPDSLLVDNEEDIPGFNPYEDEEEWTRLPSSPMGGQQQSPSMRSIPRSTPVGDKPYMQPKEVSAVARRLSFNTLPSQQSSFVIPDSRSLDEAQSRLVIQETPQVTEENIALESHDDNTLLDRRSPELSMPMAGRALELLVAREVIEESQQNNLPTKQVETSQPATNGSVHTKEVIPETQESRTMTQGRSTISEQESSQTLLDMLTTAKSNPEIRGFRTRYTYYTPLPHLVSHINRSSQYDSRVNVLAVCVRASTKSERADKGARDWFTKFRVSQPDVWPNTTLVSVFRPFKSAIPDVARGDVVLLSMFDVIPLKGGGSGLKSGDGSGWCVWKAHDLSTGDGDVLGEEFIGPPAEFGDEERKAAEDMAKWWNGASNGNAKL